jgi:hypothetical protein
MKKSSKSTTDVSCAFLYFSSFVESLAFSKWLFVAAVEAARSLLETNRLNEEPAFPDTVVDLSNSTSASSRNRTVSTVSEEDTYTIIGELPGAGATATGPTKSAKKPTPSAAKNKKPVKEKDSDDEEEENESRNKQQQQQQQVKRGQKAKMKKIKEKYKDQDEEERQLRMQLLQVYCFTFIYFNQFWRL